MARTAADNGTVFQQKQKTEKTVLGHKLISVAFKSAPAIAGLKFIYINLFAVANLFGN